jgi:hypothetical protein
MKLKSFRFGAAVATIAVAIIAVPTIVGAIGPTGNGPVTLQSGTYTPSLVSAGSLNVSSATFQQAVWQRVGDSVSLSGFVVIGATSTGFTAIDFTLPTDAPYNPTTANMYDLAGSMNAYEGVVSYPLAGGVYVDTAQKKPRVWLEASAAGSIAVHWTIQYQVK